MAVPLAGGAPWPRISTGPPSPLVSRPAIAPSFPPPRVPSASPAPLLHSRPPPLHAKRKASAPAPTFHQDKAGNEEDQEDPFVKASLNELSTEAVRVMLRDDSKRMESFLENLYNLEDLLDEEKDADALRFVHVLQGMLDHKVLPQINDLKGSYKTAFQKIFSLVEDSGWVLQGDENELGVAMLDDELIPSTAMLRYN